jgi:cellulase
MKAIRILPLLLFGAQSALGHAIFQRLRVNDVDQGQVVAVRAPAVNNPIQTVTSPPIACNTGIYTPVSTDVVTVPDGAKVGAWYEHILGDSQGANDADNPIAASHKGPIIAYIAKVDDAATADWTGVEWFKVAEEGLNTDTGTWAVDSMIAGAGWWNFTMPECVEAGQYLLRVELIGRFPSYSHMLLQVLTWFLS